MPSVRMEKIAILICSSSNSPPWPLKANRSVTGRPGADAGTEGREATGASGAVAGVGAVCPAAYAESGHLWPGSHTRYKKPWRIPSSGRIPALCHNSRHQLQENTMFRYIPSVARLSF